MNPQTGFGNRGFLPILKGVFLAAALAVGLVSCGMSSNGDNGMSMGAVNIGVTDAAGDFLSYAVDVTSLTLTRADGTVVETLPQRTRIDFAQLVDLTEFVTGATIPAGRYVSATIQLDYANPASPADIEVDDGNGNPLKVTAGNIQDSKGKQVATMSMTVKLDNAQQLVIAPGIPALFDLDFNLAASNQVDISNPLAPVVTVSPLLVADVNPDAPKPHRIRGPLDNVDTQAGTFTLFLRPFNLIQGNHGRLTFFTDSNTTFEVDQVSYVGSAGLAALKADGPLTATVAIGTFDLPRRSFIATQVLAGSSVAFGTDDVLTGNVLSRSGNTLVVKGAALVRNPGALIFKDTVTVTVDSATKVIKEGVGIAAIGDISVGQRVNVFGKLNVAATALDATGTSSLVRLLVTQLNGVVSSASSGAIVLNLARIDGRPVGLFDFTGTGTPNANPASYQVNPDGLPLGTIGNGTPLKVRGFVEPFGAATATDDFKAITLVDTTNDPAALVVSWPLLQASPFNSPYPPSGLVVNLTNSQLHDVLRGGVDVPLLTTDTPTVQAANPARGLFVIGTNGTVQVYTQMSAYQTALQSSIVAGRMASGFVAFGGPGSYDGTTKTLTAGVIATALQ